MELWINIWIKGLHRNEIKTSVGKDTINITSVHALLEELDEHIRWRVLKCVDEHAVLEELDEHISWHVLRSVDELIQEGTRRGFCFYGWFKWP